MEQIKQYLKSPIVEARIDIKVQCSPEQEVANLLQMGTVIESEYGVRDQLFHLHSNVDVDFDSKKVLDSSTFNNPVGYTFQSNNKKATIEARLDGFTFSHSSPYPGWDIFLEKGFKLWNIYHQIISPVTINSLSLRYLNRIDIPLPSSGIDLQDYLRTVPEVSSDLPEVARYVLYLQIPIEEIDSIAHVTQTSLPKPSSDIASIALDINIIKQGTISQDTEDILNTLNLIHPHASRIFESSITDVARELIK